MTIDETYERETEEIHDENSTHIACCDQCGVYQALERCIGIDRDNDLIFCSEECAKMFEKENEVEESNNCALYHGILKIRREVMDEILQKELKHGELFYNDLINFINLERYSNVTNHSVFEALLFSLIQSGLLIDLNKKEFLEKADFAWDNIHEGTL